MWTTDSYGTSVFLVEWRYDFDPLCRFGRGTPGIGYLAGRFAFKSWASGETMVSEAALSYLAREGIRFSVEGPATYERLVSTVRDPAASTLQ